MDKPISQKHNESRVIKCISKGWEIKKGIFKQLGNGEATNFWYDTCLHIGPLRNLIVGSLQVNDEKLKCAHFIKNGRWDLIHNSPQSPRRSI